MSDIRFDHRVAVITGAGGGLGKTYALALAERGADVVVNDPGSNLDGTGHDTSVADSIVTTIREKGGNAVASYDSVATVQGGEAIVETALKAYGKLDILINNAGILLDKSFTKMTEDIWDSVVSVHLKGTYCVTKPAFTAMKENRYGRIINTSSGAGLYGNFGQNNYCAAKMGLIGMMNNLAIEGAKDNILINAIAPVAASRFTQGILPPEIFDRLKPEFVTPLVLYLASEQNQETKMIFNCAAGWFSRAEMICAPGICIGDGKRAILPEEIRDNWHRITDMSGGRPLDSVMDTFGFFSDLIE